MNPTNAITPNTRRLRHPNPNALRGLPQHIFAALSELLPFITSVFSLHTLDPDPSVRKGEVIFLAGCFIAMVGCGLLSSFLQHRHNGRATNKKRSRRSLHRDSRKNSEGTVTSSEDDGYESSGSWHRASEPPRPSQQAPDQVDGSMDADDTDPGLLKKHSTYLSYSTSVAKYPSIRTFYRPHPQMDKFPTEPSPIPLLVFVHGLGCGLSSFAPTSWDAYTIEALAELLATAIDQHRDKEAGQGVVLVGHSLGCSISALLASSTSPLKHALKEHILSLVAVCPSGTPPSSSETSTNRRLLNIPSFVFELWRRWDRRGGIDSNSVTRFVGGEADADTRGLQVRYNKQSQTPVFRRMAWGALPQYSGPNDKPIGGLPGEGVWAGVRTPVLLVAGQSDTVTKPIEVQKILKYLGDASVSAAEGTNGSAAIPDASGFEEQGPKSSDSRADEEKFGVQPQEGEKKITNGTTGSGKPRRAVKTVILPAPASHGLLYDRATYRTLAGIIQDFVAQHADHRLNLGWQLQYLNTSGKWDVKNLAKWKKVPPVSERIANTFVALKMLREVDEEHNPTLFSQAHRDDIYAVIDISHESPVYNPASLEAGGIHYHKYPTVSKIPPTPDEVRDFVALVDRLQKEITEKMESSGEPKGPRPVIGVHCHYGFNRTGFLIVSYLIERCGFGVQEAIDEFEKRRPPGIRHGHFIDTLFVRYCVGLRRAPTL
ncbi:Putative Dual specificity phosphatase catalytic domain protein (AFU_orthologue; AFUA_1G03540) [Aspergillus calidoustus]|uniref:Putative Dual specificity phosphatase catalytic domain protein (AFU_orthologue AFUA_1G03540) n=1 Tax=Aspergillus calidoustus TaxID=454130 RepID=A0A0U5GGQ0_ASPCI|nr:Putative Dual specificity phosphatase catalytic domain protein (AFU_orthologue; AFUA_1G03540) [Aspergillus calidoustus]